MDYRRDIDGLRALAITPVVAFHYAVPGFKGGYVGVDVFFVISGFLIGGIILREVADGTFTYANFYARRARRILPALLVVLAASSVFAALVLSPRELQLFGEVAAASVVGLSNIAIWSEISYFAPTADLNPLLMTWSLGVEEQFYVLAPLALILLQRYGRRALAIGLVCICLGSLALSWWGTKHHPQIAFFSLPTRAWELALGVLLAFGERHAWRRHLPIFFQSVTSCVGLALLAYAIYAMDASTPFPGLAALVPALGTVLLIASPDSWINRRLLGLPLLVGLGLVSYSWYLWHWPIVSFARVVKGDELIWNEYAVLMLMSIVLAYLSWRFVERPLRRSRTAQPRLLARYAALVVGATAVTASAWASGGWPQRFDAQVQAIDRQLKENTTSCLAGYGMDAPVLSTQCYPTTGGGKVALLGDSHASALAPGIRAWAVRSGRDLVYLTKASCPPLLGISRRIASYPRHFEECDRFLRETFRLVVSDPSIDIVVLAGNWRTSIDPVASDNDIAGSDDIRQARLLEEGLTRSIAELQEHGKLIVLVQDVPRLAREPSPLALGEAIPARLTLRQWFDWGPKPSERGRVNFVADDTRPILQRVADGDSRIQLWDLQDRFCAGSSCRFMEGSTLYYADTHHLSEAGALVIADRDPAPDAQPIAPVSNALR